jgi:hypothetical protein
VPFFTIDLLFLGVSPFPIGLESLGLGNLSWVQLLGFFHVAVGADDYLTRLKEEEDAYNVGTAHSEFHDGKRTSDRCGQRPAMIVTVLELQNASGHELM